MDELKNLMNLKDPRKHLERINEILKLEQHTIPIRYKEDWDMLLKLKSLKLDIKLDFLAIDVGLLKELRNSCVPIVNPLIPSFEEFEELYLLTDDNLRKKMKQLDDRVYSKGFDPQMYPDLLDERRLTRHVINNKHQKVLIETDPDYKQQIEEAAKARDKIYAEERIQRQRELEAKEMAEKERKIRETASRELKNLEKMKQKEDMRTRKQEIEAASILLNDHWRYPKK